MKQKFFSSKETELYPAQIGQVEIKVEIADDPLTQAHGLSKRKKLADNQGMLFIYPDYAVRNFWMRDMNFPIDIIWLKDNQVVGWAKNLSPAKDENIPRASSPLAVNGALEVKAGFIAEKGVKIGDGFKLLTD